MHITASELYQRILYLLSTTTCAPAVINKMMHETLVLVCAAALKDSAHGFGDLNAQVETIIRTLHIPADEANAIRRMRRHSNRSVPLLPEELCYDARALAALVSRVFREEMPAELTKALPHGPYHAEERAKSTIPDKRGVVTAWDEHTIQVVVDEEGEDKERIVAYTEETQYARMEYLNAILRVGMHLNLLGCREEDGVLKPRLIVVEPDCLMDISTIASCFEDYGHHPLLYLVNRMKPKANTQAILLGNFAGAALDDIIHSEQFDFGRTLNKNFRDKALEYATCEGFNAQQFYTDATQQTANLQKIVEALRTEFDLHKAILEPSFVCEKLGIQGRVDLMTTDLKLLVEQKSGRNIFLERGAKNSHGAAVVEKHYVQLLLYYGILYYNFPNSRPDIRLLYSKYPLPGGLMIVATLMKLVYEAIRFRNEAIAVEWHIAHEGVEDLLPLLTPETLNTTHQSGYFYDRYLLPPLQQLLAPLQQLQPLEKAYFCRMVRFAIRENLMSRVGVVEGTGSAVANLWNMPLAEKRETGNIYTGLTITGKDQSGGELSTNGYDLITLQVPDQGEDFLPNFRRGDMVYLYAYPPHEEPDVRKALLFKGLLAEIHTDCVVVKLSDGQQNPDIFSRLPYATLLSSPDPSARPEQHFLWCLEHAGSDVGGTATLRSLYDFVTSTPERKALLLGQRAPQADETIQLRRSYDTVLDPIILKARQACDYFLLVGPPGTGKTSRALRFMVEDELEAGSTLLLLSYTNRAVDEICGMLVDANIDFLRLGHELSTAPPFVPYLISQAMGEKPKLADIRHKLLSARVVVATTSMLQSRPYLLALKHFSLAIVDESSQILEPGIIGLLAAHRYDPVAGKEQCQIDRFLLIGDYKQLPAVVQQHDADALVSDPLLQNIGLDNCKNSLFERLIRTEQLNGRTDFMGTLHHQGRMHPDVADFPANEFYASENLVPVPLKHQQDEELDYPLPAEDAIDELLKHHRVLFFASKQCHRPDISDKVNIYEAHLVADLLRRIHRFYGERFDAQKTVGVIVPYRNQIAMIRREIERLQLPELNNISIDTVERYQGSQRDVIIYSFTIQQRYQLEFLTANTFTEEGHDIDRKLNVALTRARKQMLLTGNVSTLRQSPVFDRLIQFVREKGELIE